MARVEVITGPERRRRWSAEQKRAIVAESLAPGAVVTEIARHAEIGPGQIYRCRREIGVGNGFAQVLIAPVGDDAGQVREVLKRDPHAGDLCVFRGKRGHLLKILWHDGIGMSLYAKRLERGRFLWPSPADGFVAISAAQLAYMLEGIDWRNPVHTWRPEVAGQHCSPYD